MHVRCLISGDVLLALPSILLFDDDKKDEHPLLGIE